MTHDRVGSEKKKKKRKKSRRKIYKEKRKRIGRCERFAIRMPGARASVQCRVAFIVLQQKGAHQSSDISSRLISRGRGGTHRAIAEPPTTQHTEHSLYHLLNLFYPAFARRFIPCRRRRRRRLWHTPSTTSHNRHLNYYILLSFQCSSPLYLSHVIHFSRGARILCDNEKLREEEARSHITRRLVMKYIFNLD